MIGICGGGELSQKRRFAHMTPSRERNRMLGRWIRNMLVDSCEIRFAPNEWRQNRLVHRTVWIQ
jgi:hypothetical protein